MNHEAVYRTAPATPGLLNIVSKSRTDNQTDRQAKNNPVTTLK